MYKEGLEIPIGIRLENEVAIKLDEFIIKKGLNRFKVKPEQVAGIIVEDWLENPILDKSKMVYDRLKNNANRKRLTIKLKKEDNMKLYQIYVEKYIEESSSISILIYNIIAQFLENEDATLKILEIKY